MMSGEPPTLTWWGCAAFELRVERDEDSVAFDPFVKPDRPRFGSIFCSHEHYDHYHEPTLRRLCVGQAFRRLVVSHWCLHASRLKSPIWDDPLPTDGAFLEAGERIALYPQYAKDPTITWPGPTELDVGRWRVQGVESSENPREYLDGSPITTPYPNMGYVLTDTVTGTGIYHPGDLWDAFPSMAELRGQVDIMLYPISKLQGVEAAVVDLIRPRVLIPMHYRPRHSAAFPIPINLAAGSVSVVDPITGARLPGATDEAYQRDIRTLIRRHWYPTPADPAAKIAALQTMIGDLARFVTVEAGQPYALSDLLAA
jgi:L-ascorbate metabolism protein UlaG (beta-lactamase superfamily)